MSENSTSAQFCYNSVYRHGVDEKRRLQIPAKWRTGEEEDLTLILWPNGPHREGCLLALPPAEWNSLVQKLKNMPFSDPKADSLRRLIGKKSDQVHVDKSGRISLREAMVKAAGIEKEAILVGLVDRFEIWNPERYEAASAVDEALSSEAFSLI